MDKQATDFWLPGIKFKWNKFVQLLLIG